MLGRRSFGKRSSAAWNGFREMALAVRFNRFFQILHRQQGWSISEIVTIKGNKAYYQEIWRIALPWGWSHLRLDSYLKWADFAKSFKTPKSRIGLWGGGWNVSRLVFVPIGTNESELFLMEHGKRGGFYLFVAIWASLSMGDRASVQRYIPEREFDQ